LRTTSVEHSLYGTPNGLLWWTSRENGGTGGGRGSLNKDDTDDGCEDDVQRQKDDGSVNDGCWGRHDGCDDDG
jgi:hypothetical protein